MRPQLGPLRRSYRRTLCLIFLLVLMSALTLYWIYVTPLRAVAPKDKVKLEAHIMSKCPDAQVCLRNLVVPAMEEIHDLVDFKLSFIGTANPDNDDVECKHGPDECLGNMIELCAASLYPDPKVYLGFTMCLTEDLKNIPQRDLVEGCALEHGVDFGDLNHCVSRDDGFAIGLLRSSMQRSADAGVTISCTVRLNDEIRCIRNDGEWTDCDGGYKVKNLTDNIKTLYHNYEALLKRKSYTVIE